MPERTQSVTESAYGTREEIEEGVKTLQPDVRKEVIKTLTTNPSRGEVLGGLTDIADELYWALQEGKSFKQLPANLKRQVNTRDYNLAIETSKDHGPYTGSIVGALSTQFRDWDYFELLGDALEMFSRIREPQAHMQASTLTRIVM